MKKLLRFITLSLTCAVSTPAHADLDRWTSVRALGMGNAYTAVVSDADALFYNPAALCRVKNFEWTILDPKVGVNTLKAADTYRDIQQAEKSQTDMANYLNGLYGQHYWGDVGLKSAIVIPCFGFGVYGASEFKTYMSNPAYPTLNLEYYFDYGGVLGGALPLDADGIITLGLAASDIHRTGTSNPIQAAQLSSLDYNSIIQNLKNSGQGIGLDAGLNIALPSPVHPVFSVVDRNIGTTTFSHDGGPGAPAPIHNELVAGASLEFSVPGISITPAIDVRDILRQDEPLAKKLHLGVELSLPVFDFRAGLSQGYVSLGAGADLGLFRVDAVTYSEELGAYPGQDQDRRYMLQLTVQLDLPIFKNSQNNSSADSDSEPSRSRLKQRR